MIKFMEFFFVLAILGVFCYSIYKIRNGIINPPKTNVSDLVKKLQEDLAKAETDLANGKKDAESKVEYCKTQLENAENIKTKINS